MSTEQATIAAGVEIPDHIPRDRIVDFNIFQPAGMEELGAHGAWKQLQDNSRHDLVWTPHNEGHWIALRSNMIRQMYRDPVHFSSRVIFVPKSQGQQYGLLPTRLDPPVHTPFRQVLLNAIGLPVLRGVEPLVRETARNIIADIAPRGECDFISDFCQVFPVHVFMTLCNLPLDDAEKNKGWIDQLVRSDGSMTMDEVMRRCFEYVDPLIEERLRTPGDDIISRTIMSDVDGRPLTHEEMRSLIGLLIAGGLDTVVNLMGFFMEFLATNPEERRSLIEDPKSIRKAVEELSRRFSIVVDGRCLASDTDYDGVTLKEGDMICLPTMLGGLDETVNQCPMDVDFERKGLSHMLYGEGPHICAGQHLARMELKILIEEWLERIPEFEIEPGAKISHRAGFICGVESLPLRWKTR